jgi:hypothetical protein
MKDIQSPKIPEHQSYVIDDEKQGIIKSSALWIEDPDHDEGQDGLENVSLN